MLNILEGQRRTAITQRDAITGSKEILEKRSLERNSAKYTDHMA